MIPSDLAARLRTLTEASFFETEPPLPGVQRARDIQALLPQLQAGERFMATLQRALPDGSFRAVVAGREMTLALNSSAKTGDTLELEATRITPKAVFARVLNLTTADAQQGSAQPALSQTGRLISFLLTGQPAPQPAALAANQPLLTSPPRSGAEFAPLLRQALGQSGMFYESHQAEWVMGSRDLASLLREPQAQGRLPGQPNLPGTPGSNPQAEAQTSSARPAAGSPTQPNLQTAGSPIQASSAVTGRNPQAESLQGNEALRQAAAEEIIQPRSTLIPERLLPLVHQQLDALATQQYIWQGQIWPGQMMEWIIEDPENEGEGDGAEGEAQNWNTSLRLHLPRLGDVHAQLHLTAEGVALRLRVREEATITALDAAAPALASALEAANLKLTGLVVERADDD